MITAIILTTSLVIAVTIYSCLRVSSKMSRLEEQEAMERARKWNKQREKEWCDNGCNSCTEKQFCWFCEVEK